MTQLIRVVQDKIFLFLVVSKSQLRFVWVFKEEEKIDELFFHLVERETSKKLQASPRAPGENISSFYLLETCVHRRVDDGFQTAKMLRSKVLGECYPHEVLFSRKIL